MYKDKNQCKVQNKDNTYALVTSSESNELNGYK